MEMATAVVGLVGVGAQLSLLLGQFISGCANAPALVRTVHLEINDFNSILSLLQPLILGSSPLNKSRASMVYVGQLALTITGCVCTLSEMEKEVNGLKPIGKMRAWDRLKWSRMEPTISQLFHRLLSHKSSLTLILTILTSASLAEATSCSVTLREQLVMPSPNRSRAFGSTPVVSGDHITNTDSSPTAAGPGSAMGQLDSTMGDSDSTMGDSDSTMDSSNTVIDGSDSAVDGSESIMTVTDTRVANSYRLACESTLFTTRPYRGRSNSSVISLASSQRPKPSWSLISGGSNRSVLSLPVSDYEFSGLSLAEASDMSTLPLPISANKLQNSKWYGSNTTTPHNRGGVLASKNKVLPISLYRAAELGQIGLIRQLLGQGADIEAKGEYGKTALHIAAMNNHVSAVRLLLDRGADVEATGQDGGATLHYASFSGHDSTVGLLLDRGADVEAKAQNGFTPLHEASLSGHGSIAGLLLDRGADVEAKSQGGDTPLYNASFYGHDSTVGLLLDRGADVGAKNRNGATQLHYASWNGHDSTVGLLLDRGADVEAKAKNGATPLHNASWNGHDPVVVLLLDRGADVGAKNRNGATPLHEASWNGHDSTVGLLLDRGADMEARTQNGETPLHDASFFGHDSTVGLLLDRRADVEAKSQNGETPLHNASFYGHDSTVGLLLDRGADVEAKALNGETPLHYASRNDHDSTVGLLLLGRGAGKQVETRGGETSLTSHDSEAAYQLLQEGIL